MESIWETDKLELFIAFFVPGFITYQIYGIFVGIDISDMVKRLPAVVGFSAIHYAITGWILLIWHDGVPGTIAAYVVVLVLPIFWAPIILLLRDWNRWRPVFLVWRGPKSLFGSLSAALTPEATPWDRLFDGKPKYIRIRLKSGVFVGGFLGTNSVTSTYPTDHEIYISRAWRFDRAGVFLEEITDTGLLVEGSEIETLETISIVSEEEEANGTRTG